MSKVRVLMGLLAAGTLFGATIQESLSRDIQRTDPGAGIDVIVQYRETPGEMQHARIRARGGALKQQLALLRAAAYRVPAGQIAELLKDGEILAVTRDNAIFSTGVATASGFTGSPDFGWMDMLGVSSWATPMTYTGNGVGVAVIDSGIGMTPYPELPSVVYQQSFVAGDSTTGDAYGHGSHVAGLIAAQSPGVPQGVANYAVRGIAPGVQLVSLRVLDANGAGSDSAVIAAIETAIQLKAQYNIRVINLSLGRPVTTSFLLDPLCMAVEQAWSAGITVVVAAGNDGRDNTLGTEGYATIEAPGNDPFVITVGAMNTVATWSRADDKMTSYSSKGPTPIDHVVKPDLVAPGNNIFSLRAPGSTLDVTYPANQVPAALCLSTLATGNAPEYFELSGTSMATPMVTGAVALLLQKNPNLTPGQVKMRLMSTVTKLPLVTTVATDPVTGISYTSQNDIFTVGAGYLNIPAALAATTVASGGVISPIAVWNPVTGSVGLSSLLPGVFGASIWGSSAIWGTSGVAGNSVIWGSSAIWGSSVVSGDPSSVSMNGDQ